MIEPTTLAARVDAAAAELDGVEKTIVDGRPAWSADRVTFAILADSGVELRLDPAVAEAASRTPDTGLSSRGPEWVRFSPRALDDHAVDRLEAWLMLARRRAGKAPGGTR
jgi:hypothetical protein